MALTPMMLQYFEVKEENKDCILFYRVGDFYEMFFDDAKLVSRELELTLTGKDCGLEERAPMCGVPFHAADIYISRLVSKGYKVAICEQLEDPSKTKGIVKRGIIKIVTPGTYTEEGFLEENKNNYLMCLFKDEYNYIGICAVDISTGEFYGTSTFYDTEVVLNEISKYDPKEIVFPKEFDEEILKAIDERFSVSKSMVDTGDFIYCEEVLKENFKTQQFNEKNHVICRTACGLLKYILTTQKNILSNISNMEIYDINKYLSLDINSKRNLEITENLRDKSKKGSLLWVMDKTNTAMGARKLRKWIDHPLIIKDQIEERLEAVEEIVKDSILSEDLKEVLRDIYDIERMVGKISSKSINAKELLALKASISKIPAVKELLAQCKSTMLKNIFENMDTLDDIYDILDKSINENPSLSIKEGNIIKSGYDAMVDDLRNAKSNGKQWIANLENSEREFTGIKSLKVGYNKVFGYFIEVTKSNLSSVPEGRYIRKQTLSNCERFITPELKEMEDKILGSEEKLVALEYDIFVEIRTSIEKHVERMKVVSSMISDIDALWSLAKIARDNNYCRPNINTEGNIKVQGGRHPVVEKMIPVNSFVDNDTILDNDDNQLLLITGPNMAGKSTYMRQVALITLMAQMGSFVPASFADISICDKVFTRIGASDDLAGGKSTFMVEMWEVSNILKNATRNSLVLLDEVGRGTSTYDGLSIAWSVIEHICRTECLKCKTLFATHYHELTKLEGETPGVKNYSIAVTKQNNDIIFLRKIIRGGADESYGIEVAKLAGLPEDVINRARLILEGLEGTKAHKEVKVPENLKVCEHTEVQKEAAIDIENSKESHRVSKKKEMPVQMSIEDIEKMNLFNELKNIDILKMTPMDGFNKLYDLINKAKNIM